MNNANLSESQLEVSRFEEESIELMERIEELRTDFREFAYRVAHDVNAPMRCVANFSHLFSRKCKDGVLDEEAQGYLDYINSGIEQTQKMLAALFEYSYVNTLNNPPTDIDCNLLLERCLSKLQPIITQKKALITSEQLPNLLGETQQLEKLFFILVENALAFCAPEIAPVITIKVEELSHFWLFSIHDNGLGIAKENLEDIFHVFHYFHHGAGHPGIGIGLALARKIVHHHRGKIWVSSQQGKGSTFYFSLPADTTLLTRGML